MLYISIQGSLKGESYLTPPVGAPQAREFSLFPPVGAPQAREFSLFPPWGLPKLGNSHFSPPWGLPKLGNFHFSPPWGLPKLGNFHFSPPPQIPCSLNVFPCFCNGFLQSTVLYTFVAIKPVENIMFDNASNSLISPTVENTAIYSVFFNFSMFQCR